MLIPRILSALVLAPIALAAIWVGGYVFAALVTLAGGIMCWEWAMMTTKKFGLAQYLPTLLIVIAIALGVGFPIFGVVLVLCAAVWAFITGGDGRRWLGAGCLYVGYPSLALVWLRSDPMAGQQIILWLMLLVWATDIGAYAAGRLIGGPKLMPRVSPNKTWSGLIGGMLAAAMTSACSPLIWDMSFSLWLAIFGAGLAVVAQAGDLFESWVKRFFGVKDSSRIIPGHGGVLDRVDGVLSVSIAVAMLQMILGHSVFGL